MKLDEFSDIVSAAKIKAFGADVVGAVMIVGYAEAKHGDFYTNAGYQLARVLKRSPQTLAEDLAAALKHEAFASVTAVGGYVNVRLTPEAWMAQFSSLGAVTRTTNPEKIQVEFISANPTGPTTFGNARGGFIGDTIASVLTALGHNVTREYYFNDGGTQIGKLVESVKVAAGIIKADEVQYHGAYIDQLGEEFRDELAGANDDEAATLLTQTILKRYIEPAVTKMKIKYDVWFNERSLADDGKIDVVLAKLEQEGLIYEKDGATWLSSESLGDERDRVLRKSSGDLTYLANDITYHDDIFAARGFDRAIKDWGADHVGQVPSLSLIMKRLAPAGQLDFVIHQWVRLIRGGEEVKMSKRAGTFVTVEDVIDEVGSDVARFFFLMRSADTALDFDLDLAREQSQKNPLYYCMYSYARACSIIKLSASKGLMPSDSPTQPNELEIGLIRHMYRWSELLTQIGRDYGVHRLSFYGLELTRLFHEYYESQRIIDLPAEIASNKLAIIAKYVQFMEGYFRLLGIEPIAVMQRDLEA